MTNDGRFRVSDERISVSREMLRADLAEMELRLIEKLASRESVAALDARVQILERTALIRGGPVDDQVKKLTATIKSDAELNDMIDAKLDLETGKSWTSRDRLVAFVLAAIAVATFIINLVHPFSGTPTPHG
jgi:hypothetical protein